MEFMKRIMHFFKYWYVRYLLATELYMVDDWEKIVTHITMAICFYLFWVFNNSIVLNGISQLRGFANIAEITS